MHKHALKLAELGDVSYKLFEKKAFATAGRAFLRDLAKRLGLQKGQFDLRYNEGGIAVSGEVTLHSESLYVQISQLFGRTSVLYRGCRGRKDYCGLTNHTVSIDELATRSDRLQLFEDECLLLALKSGPLPETARRVA